MKPKLVNEEYTSFEVACRKDGEEQIKKMLEKFLEPVVCPKPGCGCTKFLRHEDGWQCWNCFKIIYVRSRNGRKKNNQLVLI